MCRTALLESARYRAHRPTNSLSRLTARANPLATPPRRWALRALSRIKRIRRNMRRAELHALNALSAPAETACKRCRSGTAKRVNRVSHRGPYRRKSSISCVRRRACFNRQSVTPWVTGQNGNADRPSPNHAWRRLKRTPPIGNWPTDATFRSIVPLLVSLFHPSC